MNRKILTATIVLMAFAILAVGCASTPEQERAKIDSYLSNYEGLVAKTVRAMEEGNVASVRSLLEQVMYNQTNYRPLERYESMSSWTGEDSRRFMDATARINEGFQNNLETGDKYYGGRERNPYRRDAEKK